MKFKDLHPPILELAPGQTFHRVQLTRARKTSVRINGLLLAPTGLQTGRFCLPAEATAYLALCADARRTPTLVIRVAVESVYLHCAKAFMRSQLWDASRQVDRGQLPSMAEMMRDQIRTFKGEEIEAETQAQTLERYRQSL